MNISFHTPYKQIEYNGKIAYEKKYFFRTAMWVVEEHGLHLYYNDKPSHPFGVEPLVLLNNSTKWLATISQIKADIDGFWRHDNWWLLQTKLYRAGRDCNPIARMYLEQND